MIETLDDIIEQLADGLGVYGAERRHCWTSELKARIIQAVEIESGLIRVQAPEVGTINGPGVIHPADVRKLDELDRRVEELTERCDLLNKASGAYVGELHDMEKRVAELERKLEYMAILFVEIQAREQAGKVGSIASPKLRPAAISTTLAPGSIGGDPNAIPKGPKA